MASKMSNESLKETGNLSPSKGSTIKGYNLETPLKSRDINSKINLLKGNSNFTVF